MIRPPSLPGQILPAICGLLLFGSLALVLAQPERSTAARPPRQQSQNPPFRFGDVTISGFDTLSGELGGRMAEARGPNTTVDAVDPKQKSRSQLKASRITAYLTADPKKSEVERIEAVGNVRFSGSRPAASGMGEQTVRGTGSRSVYYKKEERIVLDGPVTFYAEQPTPDGKQRQSVEGRANQAQWEVAKQVLTFSGDVQATVTMPDALQEPARLVSDVVVLDVGARPMKFELRRGEVNFFPRSREREEKKP